MSKTEVIYELLEKSSQYLELREEPMKEIVVSGLRAIKVLMADKPSSVVKITVRVNIGDFINVCTSLTTLGDTIIGGVKVEEKVITHKKGLVVVSGCAMFGRGDVAYGGSLEATLRDKEHHLGPNV